ncbi:MAG TPA: S8 family peptidase [Gemmatimonadaceae bacterium]|nr:S8 family peptidase [Gemmatimonadaceae bacterium]
MKRLGMLTIVAVGVVACQDAAAPTAPEARTEPVVAPVAQAIPNQYIVVLREGSGDFHTMVGRYALKAGAKVKYEYSAVIHGFAGVMSAEAAAALAKDPGVAYVEQDQVMHTTTTQSGATWGIDRIDQRSLPLSGTYTYTSTGTGVRAYIIDTGIQTSHPQFGGRASAVYDAFGGNGQDCNGHGTHVAGTVGSSTYGVAKNVYLRAVRVLDCNGSGSNSGVIAGMDWVRTNAIKPAVANMSLGGGYSSAVNSSATNLANSGVLLAVAAGNSSADACNSSPSSASGTITVAASTSTDARASYSNYGGCVDIYAPGSSITSTWLNGGTNTISGTSMATPHVTGVAALYKATYGDAASSTVISWLTGNATSGVISGNVSGTPNRLLYKSTL